jgi:hypothetical protein
MDDPDQLSAASLQGVWGRASRSRQAAAPFPPRVAYIPPRPARVAGAERVGQRDLLLVLVCDLMLLSLVVVLAVVLPRT